MRDKMVGESKLTREPGVFVPHRDRRTKGKKYKELDNDLTYTANQLDRDVVSENQIRLVLRTFRDKLPEIFPGRTEVPKTLVFAKTDLHAEDIVRIIREEFGKGNDFCQKITSKSTGKKPDELLSEFRNSYFPRIAVTVDISRRDGPWLSTGFIPVEAAFFGSKRCFHRVNSVESPSRGLLPVATNCCLRRGKPERKA